MAKAEKPEKTAVVATKVKKAPKKKADPEPVVKRDRIDWRALYLYAVCLITMLVCLFSIVSFIRNGVSYVYPDPGYIDPNATGGKAAIELAKSTQLTQSHRQSVMGMVDGVTTFIVAAPLYYYHWNLVRKEH